MNQPLCPPAPSSIQKDLTSLPSAYKLKATLAVLAIILFFALYFSLVVALGFLVKHAFIYPIGDVNKFTILLKLGAIAGSVMLFVFTLKFILKLKNYKADNRIKLNEKDQPELFQFVYQICKETHAPKPKAIYVDPDVNAYVAYTNVWLSLLFPTRKELTLGLGIVSTLNISEFKAVIAHEFGHFAQRSMKIGSYIVSANTIIHDMIFVRDKWDNILEQWRGADIRLSAAAWVITPVIWIIRQLLNLFYQFLNIMHSSLSREMEFNADKVAVSVTGSDAIVSSLWKLDSGSTVWSNTINNAYLASQKDIYTQNLYHHIHLDLQRNLPAQNEAFTNLPVDSRGGKKFFSVSENSRVSMYSSHPRNDQREDNAKSPYIACETDNRSPWVIFNNQEQIQQQITLLIYNQYLQKEPKNFVSVDDFEAFIASENQGVTLLKEYQNTFEARFFEIPSNEVLQTPPSLEMPISKAIENLKAELTLLMQPIAQLDTLIVKAQEISAGTTKDKSFTYSGISYTKRNLNEGYQKLLVEKNRLLNETFTQWDTKFCQLHFHLASQQNQQAQLQKLYSQHRAIVDLYKSFVGAKNRIVTDIQYLQSSDNVTQSQVNNLSDNIFGVFKVLNTELGNLNSIDFVPLSNIDTIDELKEALVTGGAFAFELGSLFENQRLDKLMNALERAISHCQRIDQKSIAAILLFHNQLCLAEAELPNGVEA